MDPILSSIVLFAFPHQIEGWAPCDGRLLQVRDNPALFSLLGTNYGGDGQTTFALPKLAAPQAGMSYQIAVQGMYPSRP